MTIKAGQVYLESKKTEDAIWEWEVGSMVDIVTEDEFLVLRIDPTDLIAITDHIIAEEKRNHEKNKKDA